jgi:hypothetical protein
MGEEDSPIISMLGQELYGRKEIIGESISWMVG